MHYDDCRAFIAAGALCSVCHARATDAHHLAHKGMGGRGAKADDDADDCTPLCRSCHTAHHDAGELRLRRSKDRTLVFAASGKYAKKLGVKEHHDTTGDERHPDEYDTPPADDRSEALGDALWEADAALDAALARANAAKRDAADAVAEGLRLCQMELGERKGRAEWVEWRKRQGLGKGEAADMLLVATYVPRDAARLIDWRQQVQLARVIEHDREDLLIALPDAESLSVSDFAALYLGKQEPKPRAKEAVCPVCQHHGPSKEFKPCS